MGLLDWNDKQQMGLLGMSVLANSGQGNLRSLGSGLQQGLALDNQMKTQALQRQQLERKNRMEDEALASARESERARQLRLQAARQWLISEHPKYSGMASSLPDDKLDALLVKMAEQKLVPEEFTLKEGDTRYRGTQELVKGPEKQSEWDKLAAAGGLTAGTPEYDQARAKWFDKKTSHPKPAQLTATYGSLTPVMTETGPAMAQPNNRGGINLVHGVRPFSQKAEDKKQVAAVDAVNSVGKIISSGEDAIRLVDEVVNHPGMSKAVGWQSMFPTLPGSDAADFESRLEQIKGKSFLEAFETLKGGGQITQIEGDKATQALNRMRLATSEREFVSAAEDFKKYVKLGMEKAAAAAKQAGAVVGGSGAGDDPLGIRGVR